MTDSPFAGMSSGSTPGIYDPAEKRLTDSEKLQLIRLVERVSFLWDPHQDDYKNINRRKDAWNRIGSALKLSASQAQRGWDHLRGQYTRECNRRPASTVNSPVCWKFFEHMNFLAATIRKKRPTLETEYQCTSEHSLSPSGAAFDYASLMKVEDGGNDRESVGTTDETAEQHTATNNGGAPASPASENGLNGVQPAFETVVIDSPYEQHQLQSAFQRHSPHPREYGAKRARIAAATSPRRNGSLSNGHLPENSSKPLLDEDQLFVQYACATLKKLPAAIRAKARADIQQILYRSEIAMLTQLNGSIDS